MMQFDNIPNHIAIIMDGNGRWAVDQDKPRIYGHKHGVESVRSIVEAAREIKISHLTLYAFSTENWGRPDEEVGVLMNLLVRSLRSEFRKMMQNEIRLQAIGRLDTLPSVVREELEYVTEKTQNNTGMVLTLALSYGSREELVQAFCCLAEKVKSNTISLENLDESVINEHLYTRNLPDVDLLIRTSGEQRVSNFLLWQIAYAELYFTEKLWPDFGKEDLHQAILNYQQRERRFGKTSQQLQS
ncbi:MAG: isoprenyl transferase [Flavobacteriaceae bacterium]